MPTEKITLEAISLRKEEVLKEIRQQKERMATTTHELFAPLAPAATKADALARSFNTGMAIFDGVMMGMKVMRKVRSFFNRWK